MYDTAQLTAQQCAQICDNNGEHKSAEQIRAIFHLVKPPCALLAPKVIYENSPD
jgi:hypothetical protein